jgi:hypothetical protein
MVPDEPQESRIKFTSNLYPWDSTLEDFKNPNQGCLDKNNIMDLHRQQTGAQGATATGVPLWGMSASYSNGREAAGLFPYRAVWSTNCLLSMLIPHLQLIRLAHLQE